MFVEKIGYNEYRKVEIGDKIYSQGCAFEVAKIISQADYGEDGGIYIEFEDPKGDYHYWKEGCDGGYVKSVSHGFHKKISIDIDFDDLYTAIMDAWESIYPDDKDEPIYADWLLEMWDDPAVNYFDDIEVATLWEYDEWLDEFLLEFMKYLVDVKHLEEL